jgi:hypothetical protein
MCAHALVCVFGARARVCVFERARAREGGRERASLRCAPVSFAFSPSCALSVLRPAVYSAHRTGEAKADHRLGGEAGGDRAADRQAGRSHQGGSHHDPGAYVFFSLYRAPADFKSSRPFFSWCLLAPSLLFCLLLLVLMCDVCAG